MHAKVKEKSYQDAARSLKALLENETNLVLKMATINSVLRDALPYYFWTGFYIVENDELIVGPYQGTLGCLHIAFGKGVCGTAAATGKTQLVPDVHAFPGHIACDSRSQSEIVVPVHGKDGKLIAVFDVDSAEIGSFDAVDQKHLESMLRRHFG